MKTHHKNKFEFKLNDLEHRVKKTPDGKRRSLPFSFYKWLPALSKRRETSIEDLERWSKIGKSNYEEETLAPKK